MELDTDTMFTESHLQVAQDPAVTLWVAEAAGPLHQTLLVIHGGPDWDHTYLREPVNQLAGQHRVLLPDLRGCGRSTRGLPDDLYTWDAVVADLLTLLDAKDADRVDVLGFSTGGLIAQRLVLTAPERVRRLVIASSSVIPLPPDAFDGWLERTKRLKETTVSLAPGLSEAEVNSAEATAFAPINVWRQESLPDYLQRVSTIRFSGDWTRPWNAGTLPPVRVPDAERRLAELGVPMLLLHGRQDMTFPANLAEQTAARNPAARAVILDEAGHMAHIDQPHHWVAALARFLV